MGILAEHAKGNSISPTFKLAAKARELAGKGIDVLNLSIGEADCGTPENIKKAAHKAIDDERTLYTPVDGIAELKDAIYRKYLKRVGYENFSPNNIIASSGAKYILYGLFWASLNKGDEVLLPTPYWVSYSATIKMNKGVTVSVECKEQNNFKLDPEELDKAITKKSKLLLINSPNNPSGVKYSRSELREIVEVVKKYPNLYIISDDIYEDFTYDDDIYSLIDVAPELSERIFIVNGCSKTYAMTGWRIGYGIGCKEVINAIKIMQSQSLSGPCSISQYAAVEALDGDQTAIQDYMQILKKRRDIVYKFFTETEGFTCVKPSGAFYVFPSCSKFVNSTTPNGMVIKDDKDFCNYLLETQNVFVIPGSVFGVKNHFRLSYAVKDDVLQKALLKIAQATAKLKISTPLMD
ncbi:MAG: pyridoxal phosphate-dependent aminotransferase [Rickettsiales bacterium]|nr:pyridoxal phosphate-dependent aminotransferase [Rickettsiales bacterium]